MAEFAASSAARRAAWRRLVPGQCLLIRRQRWRVEDTRVHRRCKELLVRGAELTNAHLRRTFIVPCDRPAVVLPAPVEWTKPGALARARARLLAYQFLLAPDRACFAALSRGRLAIKPYQLVPVAAALEASTPRLLLADEVGLGKTIEAGLILVELATRGRANRALIVTPAALCHQWAQELCDKFSLDVPILDAGALHALRADLPAGANPWRYVTRAIASIDFLKRAATRREVTTTRWDLVIIDEAHEVARTGPEASDRAGLATRLARCTEALLLLTATPHSGEPRGFASLLRLLDPAFTAGDRVLPAARGSIVRRLKRDVRAAPPASPASRTRPQTIREATGRRIEHVVALPTPAERALDDAVARFAIRQWRRAHRQSDEGLALAMTVLRKRAASSPAALRATLRRRLTLIEAVLDPPPAEAFQLALPVDTAPDEEERDPWLPRPGDRRRSEAEQRVLRLLLERAAAITPAIDSKLARARTLVSALLTGRDDKIIIFTEFRDTLEYLDDNFKASGLVTTTYHGGLDRTERLAREARFAARSPIVLLATDAASQGLNLHRGCRTIVHYDLPWNPNRLEQRNGRVDRVGQDREVCIFTLSLDGVVDADLLQRLYAKIERIGEAIGTTTPVLAALDPGRIERQLMGGPAPSSRLDARHERSRPDRFRSRTEFDADDLERLEDAARKGEQALATVSWADACTPRVERMLARTMRLSPSTLDLRRVVRAGARTLGGRVRRVPTDCPARESSAAHPGGAGVGGEDLFEIDLPVGSPDIAGEPVRVRGTFDRDAALAHGPTRTFFSPGHPLIDLLLRQLIGAAPRDASAPGPLAPAIWPFAAEEDSMVAAYVIRFVDGLGALVAEDLRAVRVTRDGRASPMEDLTSVLPGPREGRVERRSLPDRVAGWCHRARAVAEQSVIEFAERRAADLAQAVREEETRRLAWGEARDRAALAAIAARAGDASQAALFAGPPDAPEHLRRRHTRIVRHLEHLRARAACRAQIGLAGRPELVATLLVGGRGPSPARGSQPSSPFSVTRS